MPSHRYALKVAVNAVACDVTVNHVPVVRNYAPDRTDFTLPVSEYIKPGHNMVAIRALVDLSEGGKSATRATATLLASRFDVSDWQPLFSVTTRAVPSAEGEISAEPLASELGAVSPQSSDFDPEIMLLENRRVIALEADVPDWNWTRSAPIDESEETRLSLVRWYAQLVDLIDERNTVAVDEIMREKYAELSLSHGLPPDEVAAEIGLSAAIVNEALVRRPVIWDALQIEVAAGGRLTRLYHPAQGSVISFRNEDQVRHGFEFWLRQEEDGWRVAR